MTQATTVIEVRASTRGLVITEKYMGFVNYVYPMVVNWPAKHRVFRETLLKTMFSQIELFHLAAKSDQASRLYAADAGLAVLREFLRFAASPARKLLSRHQHEVAEVHLAKPQVAAQRLGSSRPTQDHPLHPAWPDRPA